MSDLVLILLIVVYLVLNHLSSFFFQIPFALGFYIRFGSHSFNFDVFSLESFIELILSLNFIHLYFIFISNMVLIFLLLFLVVLILF